MKVVNAQTSLKITTHADADAKNMNSVAPMLSLLRGINGDGYYRLLAF